MPVVGEKLEQLIPSEDSKPRSPQVQKPLVATKLVHETPDKEFTDVDNKIYKSPKKIIRDKKVVIPLKGVIKKSKGNAKKLNYTPRVKKVTHQNIAPEFSIDPQQKEDIKNRIFKMRQRIGL